MATKILEQKEPIEGELVAKIMQSENRSVLVQTTLQTNEQVIARVTDGIYRQPASAIRELISNAYDADATRVIVKTDAPGFERITIEDDGVGMSPDVLAYLLYNIGGSAKRNETGEDLGITSKANHLRSPGGRRLIGKIGIGLFSVSQLTHSFQIITKRKGDDYRTVATVSLRQFSDSEVAPSHGAKRFESGIVHPFEGRTGITSGLVLDGRDLVAPVLGLGFYDANGLFIDEQNIISGADIGLVLTHGDALARVEIESLLILNHPTRFT